MSPYTHFDQSTNDDSNDDALIMWTQKKKKKNVTEILKAIETGSNDMDVYTTTIRSTSLCMGIIYTGVE